MNTKTVLPPMEKEDLTTLRLMGEIDQAGIVSQRELSRRLNISLGLVNTFIKRLVNKGYFKVTTMPRKRVKYFLTPAGLARKSRLTVEYLKYSVDSYREIKKLLLRRFKEMEETGVQSIYFYGTGEVAELAFLYLQLSSIRLAGIIDEKKSARNFFGNKIVMLDSLPPMDGDCILLTRLEDMDRDKEDLIKHGIAPERIITL
jgi:DNA-binding MarR family transcriptional regulator